jgi:TolB-like protein
MNSRLTFSLSILILTAGLVASGCTALDYNWGSNSWYTPTRPPVQDSDLVVASYQAADSMLEQVPWLRDSHQPLLTGTFVNVNSLENSSSLGRIITDQIASRFAQKGFTMIEVTLRNNIFVKENAGEFVLSRSVQDISRSHNVAAVIAGTYAVGKNSVYVSARLIRAADSLILAGYDYNLPLGPDTKALVASQ